MSDLQKLFDDFQGQCFAVKSKSNATRTKLSEKLKGRKSPMLGKIQSQEARAKISQANKGKTISEDTKRKMRENRTKGKPVMTPLGEFHSKSEASRAYNVSYKTLNYWIRVSKKTEFYVV